MECAQGYKYRYPRGVSTKVPFTLTKAEEEEEEETPGTPVTASQTATTSTPVTSVETHVPTTTT